MAAVRRLCETGIYLERGNLIMIGNSNEIVEEYLQSIKINKVQSRKHGKQNHIMSAFIISESGKEQQVLYSQENYFLLVQINSSTKNLNLGFTVFNSDDIGIFSSITSDTLLNIPEGIVSLKIRMPINFLNIGFYRVEATLGDYDKIYDSNEFLAFFQVVRDNDFESRGGKPVGLLRISDPWIIDSGIDKFVHS